MIGDAVVGVCVNSWSFGDAPYLDNAHFLPASPCFYPVVYCSRFNGYDAIGFEGVVF